jgi:hypothetical protein
MCNARTERGGSGREQLGMYRDPRITGSAVMMA